MPGWGADRSEIEAHIDLTVLGAIIVLDDDEHDWRLHASDCSTTAAANGAAAADDQRSQSAASFDAMDGSRHPFAQELVAEYLRQADAVLADIRLSLASGDRTVVSDRAHLLKGSAASLGLRQVRAACERLQQSVEVDIVDGGADPAAAAEAELETCAAVVAGHLRRFFGL
ncbi:hypothetical protein DFJ73DRAFT_845281 [Zopfochytrium polystomum]|nr:hypothetical protein DFJ73DRAFT_845281 [Zopfochytrium polystomum]